MEFNILRLDDSSDSMTNYTMIYYCWVVEFYITLHCTLKLDDSRSNSMTIIIISVTIMTVIHVVKNYYHNTGHVVIGMCIGHCLVSTCPQPCKKHEKMARNISDEIDLDNGLEVFLLEGSESGIWEYLVSLPQVEMLRICI